MKHTIERACRLIQKEFFTQSSLRKGRINGFFCATHKADCCRCGEEWGKHGSETTVEEYRKFISTLCVCCNKNIPGTWSWYMTRGNYCLSCPPKRKKDKKRKSGISRILSAAQKRLLDIVRKKRK